MEGSSCVWLGVADPDVDEEDDDEEEEDDEGEVNDEEVDAAPLPNRNLKPPLGWRVGEVSVVAEREVPFKLGLSLSWGTV